MQKLRQNILQAYILRLYSKKQHHLVMRTVKQKQLIISLIKDDLINSKLINGLNQMGLDAHKFYLHLPETIFEQMGITDNKKKEILLKRYTTLSEKMRAIDLNENYKATEELAEEIYGEMRK
jgi:hypothetical protein